MHSISGLSRQRGLTLIELMVALIVGMLVTLAATSGASFFESMRRSSVGSSSALENGIAVSFDVQRHVQGAGLWAVKAPCNELWQYDYTDNIWKPGSTNFASFFGLPVEIDGDPSDTTTSDRITTRSTSGLLGAPVALTAESDGSSATLEDAAGINVGNLVAIHPAISDALQVCFMATVTAVSGSDITLSPFASGAAVTSYPLATYGIGSQVFKLGNADSTLFRVTNKVNSKDLDVFESINLQADADGDPDRNGSTTVLAENIVQIRAQYGISDSATNLAITQWVNPGSSSAVANRLRAIRMVVVARSQQPNLKERDANGVCTTTTASPAIPWTITSGVDDTPRALDLDLAAQPDRRCYEYRVTNIVVPLKNYMFSGGGA